MGVRKCPGYGQAWSTGDSCGLVRITGETEGQPLVSDPVSSPPTLLCSLNIKSYGFQQITSQSFVFQSGTVG